MDLINVVWRQSACRPTPKITTNYEGVFQGQGSGEFILEIHKVWL